jgi:hypothetical protein
MSVDVDFGAGHVIYDVEASESYTSDISDEVQNRGTGVYGYLTDLELVADQAGNEALEQIALLTSFSVDLPPVSFVAPAAPAPAEDPAPAVSGLGLALPSVDAGSFSNNFSHSLKDAVSGSWDAPEDINYTAPPLPAYTTPEPLPGAPSAYDMPVTNAPVSTLPVFEADYLTAPDLFPVEIGTPPEVLIEDFVVTVETAELLKAIEDMKAFNPTPPELPEYFLLIPEVFTVTGSMAAGDTIVNYVQLLENRDNLLNSTAPSVSPAFSRRGLYQPPTASEYDTWLRDVVRTKLGDSDTVFEALSIDDCVKSAFQLGTAAHRMLVDIETALYSLEFDAAKAAADARLQRAKTVGSVYAAEVLLLRQEIAQYNATAAQVTANAKVFEAEAEQAALIGSVNTLEADVFSTTEGVKGVDADVFDSRVGAEKTKLMRYKAIMEGKRAAVAAAEGDVAAYSGTVAQYMAEVLRTSTEYDVYSSRTQGVQFDNSARAATLQAEGTQLKSYAALADSAASSASVKAIDLQAKAAIKETTYIKRAISVEEEATRVKIRGSDYDDLLNDYSVDLATRTASLRYKSRLGSSISRYVETAQTSIGRAAQLSQTANIQLARTYEMLYTAAGRAGASVASGKLSAFRASASLSAGEGLSASNTYSVGYSGSGSNSFGESDNYS